MHTSIGGVGHNVALAASFAGHKTGITTRLISVVGQDGKNLLEDLKSTHHEVEFDTSGILQLSSQNAAQTAKYVAFHNADGDLIMACADMDIVEKMDLGHIKAQILQTKPKAVLFDGNIGTAQKTVVIETAKSVDCIVGFEPTSAVKAAALAEVPGIQTFPRQSIDFATPTVLELKALHKSFADRELFNIDNWFSVLDALNFNDRVRYAFENLTRTVPELRDLLSEGIVQRSVQLLPYIPNLFIKNGAKGVYTFQIVEDSVLNSIKPVISSHDSSSSITTRYFKGSGPIGLLFQHYPAVKMDNSRILSTTGAGDTFCGVLLSEIARSSTWLDTASQEKAFIIGKAQQSASLTIQSKDSVSKLILDL